MADTIPYSKRVFKDCWKCRYCQPVTSRMFECARNFPPECCIPNPKKEEPVKEPKKKIRLDDMAIWTFFIGMMMGFGTATVIFNCVVPLLKG